MVPPTLAEKLGITQRDSLLSQKARRLSLSRADTLEALAIGRGCWHYRQPGMAISPEVSEFEFTNEDLAVALLSPRLPYSPHTIRVGAAMVGAMGNSVDVIVRLAKAEGCEAVVRYIARAGIQFEPTNSFWREVTLELSQTIEIPAGVMPHPTRFVSMTGFTRSGPGRLTIWIRPRAELSIRHG